MPYARTVPSLPLCFVVINAICAELDPEVLAAEVVVDGEDDAWLLLVVLLLPPQAAITTAMATGASATNLPLCNGSSSDRDRFTR